MRAATFEPIASYKRCMHEAMPRSNHLMEVGDRRTGPGIARACYGFGTWRDSRQVMNSVDIMINAAPTQVDMAGISAKSK